ncbi:diguanylate cyclase [Trichlorobacter ammonificans]|uniref:diguanylate cyclase n=1 Tax=Trichlorobacter ammonificans TaxID=2916410 RepID=A0ABN8HLK2_9BACT|nr:diguanylate cyclase [Trichlorobacter ammonificans]CAH2032058.1 Response regulator receiver modulated diguanylate cyclase [Trichlorobacter ammonificans]
MSPRPRIALISSEASLTTLLQLRLQSKGYQVTVVTNSTAALGTFYSDPPDLIIVDFSSPCIGCRDMLFMVRSDSFFSTIPILGIFPAHDEQESWDDFPLDDFVTTPLNFSELFSRITLSLSRIKRIFDNNPLTRLPGNTSIHRAIDESMGLPLAVCYVDIDHFKPYNDVFGFSHGDEVIRMLARIMSNAVRETGGGFCGHVGGDDFVFIVPRERAEQVCEIIIRHFDQIVQALFDEQTRASGVYQAFNRKGEPEEVPILGVSIAVVLADSPSITHAARVAEVAAELKKKAKQDPGSSFVMDKRTTPA